MIRFTRGILVFVALVTLAACGDKNSRTGIDPTPEHKASTEIQDSFQISKVNDKGGDNEGQQTDGNQSDVLPQSAVKDVAKVKIKRSALEKEFLLTTNLIAQSPTPMFTSMQSRVVYFTIRSGWVYMHEAAPGRAVGKNNPKQFLPVAEFEILDQSGDDITIDFNSGMKNIIIVGDMAVSDYPTDTSWVSATVAFSYLEDVRFEDNKFYIRQVAQVQGDTLIPFEVRYYLTPYNPDPNFVPRRSPGHDQVGYFEANPLLDVHGNTINYAMKFNEKKPIVFAMSANTPEEYKETVRQGILYWNKTLGENKIQVVELKDPSLTAPNPDYNIVQWVNWDSAGYAYADAHVDPRSGEVTHAQVFFPSAFTEAAIEKRVRTVEGSKNRKQIGLRGFKNAALCRRDLFKEFSQSVHAAGAISKEAMKKAVKDYVYEVIAHEIGHVLGLRHNFAGNLAANYDMSERRDLVLSYYQNMQAPEGIVASSSVMEYSRFEESGWNADKVQKGAPALSHDIVTMEFLYKGIEVPADSPAFCTDSHIEKFADCNMSDASRSIVSYTTGNYKYAIETLPVRILNQYISESKVSDDPGVPSKPVAKVLLNPMAHADSIAIDRFKFASLLKEEVRLIQVRSKFLPIWPADDNNVFSIEKDYVADEISRLGGLSSIVDLSEKNLAKNWSAKFQALLADSKYNQGVIGNTTYAFTETEMQLMQKQFNLFAEKVQHELIKHTLKALTAENVSFEATYGQAKAEKTQGWFDHKVSDELALVVQNISNHYLFAKNETKTVVPVVLKEGAPTLVELPVFTYGQDVRLLAANVWTAPHVALEWAYNEKPMHAEQMKKELAVIAEADKIDFTKTDKIALRWLLQNKEIAKKLE